MQEIKDEQESGSQSIVERISSEHQPVLVVLCGPSHAGKSTFVRRFQKNFTIISSDKIREELHSSFGDPEIEASVWNIFESTKCKALKEGRDIILDACHMSRGSRWHALQGPNGDYKKICIIFDLPLSVLQERCLRTKRVSLAEVERMWRAFHDSKPTTKELKQLGFDEVYFVRE